MGNTKSKGRIPWKRKWKDKDYKEAKQKGYESIDIKQDGLTEAYDDAELKLLRRTIRIDPEAFILNNLMMCVQFFKNYDEEIEQARQTLTSSREKVLNDKLPPHKKVLLPDVLQEQVARNVGFTSSRQTYRPTVEPLHPVRIYVIHDDIEVFEVNNPPHYSSINNELTYNMLLKESDHYGYVKLQLFEETPVLKNTIREENENYYSDGESIYGTQLSSKSVPILTTAKNSLSSLKNDHSRSLSDLYNDSGLYEEQDRFSGNGASSMQDVRTSCSYRHRASSSSNTERKRRRHGTPSSRKDSSRNGTTFDHHHQSRTTKPWMNNRSSASSTSSGYRSSNNYAMDSDNDYSSVNNGNQYNGYDSNRLTKSSENIVPCDIDSNSTIPKCCFQKITLTGEGKVFDPLEYKKLSMNNKQRRIRMALKRYNYDVYYVNSEHFMFHFMKIFREKLSEVLGFDRETIKHMKFDGCITFCDKVKVNTTGYSQVEPYEVIPCVWLQWPECAKEWLDRPRATWPNDDDIIKIMDIGCYSIPEGFLPKKDDNPYYELEWQLSFPAAERYLETCITHAQMHVYLMSLMLHKAFIRPVFDTMFGLTTSHIRNKLFWMIEEDDRPSRWPDHRTGECLLKLLKSLYCCISQNEPTLPDYFVRDRNLLQRVPNEHLLHTQKQLKRIIENPIMYVFHAMENVRYSHQFFPRIDYEKLLTILTTDALSVINPALSQHRRRPLAKTAEDRGYSVDDDSDRLRSDKSCRPGSFWTDAKTMSKTQEEQQIYSTKPAVTNKTLINPRKATDSIIEISVRCATLEGPRLCALLDFFIQHFIKMCIRFHQYHASHQKKIYLDQAERLSLLLFEFKYHRNDAREYRDKIKNLRMRAMTSTTIAPSMDVAAPKTPKRNSQAPIYTAPLNKHCDRESLDEMQSSTDGSLYEPLPDEERKRSDVYRESISTMAIIHNTRDAESTARYRSPMPIPSEAHVLEPKYANSVPSRDHGKQSFGTRLSSSRSGDDYRGSLSRISLDEHQSTFRDLSTRDDHHGSSRSSLVKDEYPSTSRVSSITDDRRSSSRASSIRNDHNNSSRSSSIRNEHRSASRVTSNNERILMNGRNSKNLPIDRIEPSSDRVISLTKDQNESFLTETTYI